jgi:hypothetical protein
MPADAEGNAVLVPDHGARMQANMSQQFAKPRIKALTGALGLGMQCLEEEAFGVLISSPLETASDDGLDQWGALVGERRGGLDDDDYRVFIEARILANRSGGSPDELIEIWRRITAPQLSVRWTLHPPACFSLAVLRVDPMSDARARRVGAVMRSIKPGGVAMFLVESVTGYFGFLDDPGHPGEPADDGASLGYNEGLFSRVL